MKALSFFLSLCLALAVSMSGCGGGGGGGAALSVGEWTADNFPSHIRRLTQFGERADWSHDGQRILFIEKTFGDVLEIELATGIIRPMTRHYVHKGYTRALYLSNGDILLSGSRTFSAENPVEARIRTAELWVLSQALDRPAVPLGEFCFEGPAVSRSKLRIAWTLNNENTPALPAGVSQFWQAFIDYSGGGTAPDQQDASVGQPQPAFRGRLGNTELQAAAGKRADLYRRGLSGNGGHGAEPRQRRGGELFAGAQRV